MIKKQHKNPSSTEQKDIAEAPETEATTPLEEPILENNGDDSPAQYSEKLAELDDKYKRLYAEFDNYRRRTSKEKIDLIQYAAEQTIKELLPVIDDYERAISDIATKTDIPEETKEGIRLIYQKLMGVLDRKGVKAMETKGASFDENLHEAITHIPVGKDQEKGQIVDEIQRGYFMHEKVIRFAKVVVAM